MYLHDRANKDGTCYPAIGTIARELKLSRSTVKRAISDLEQSGRLRKEQRWRENGGKSSNLYYLTQVDSS
jgi:predicted transcriptional regulator